MSKYNRTFRILSAALIIFTLIAALGSTPAMAKGKGGKIPKTRKNRTTVAMVTEIRLIAPGDQATCAPQDNIRTTGVPEGARVKYDFFVISGPTLTRIGGGNAMGNINVPFPYPEINGTMTFSAGVAVFDGQTVLFKDMKKWVVKCDEGTPPPSETPTKTPTEPPTKTPTPTEPPTETPTPTEPPTETPTKTPTETPTDTPTPTEPPSGGQGCTPGYWRQEQHLDNWVGYYPTNDFAFVFTVTPSFDPHSLLDAVWLGGGGEEALARHAVAALLNSSNPSVSYMYSTADVISMVQQAYATGNFETIKNLFEAQNEIFCPLD